MYVKVEGVCKKYGQDSSAFYALKDVNVEIEKSEIAIILGASGSGKSTLLNLIGGLDKVTEGTIRINDEDITGYSEKLLCEYRRNKLGYIFQFYNLIADLNVKDNIEVCSDISRKKLDTTEIIQKVGLSGKEKQYPSQLSGGQQQRVAIARAVVKSPDILLCDEPTGALDSKSSKEIMELLLFLNQEYKTTIVIVTHNENLKYLAHRIISVKDGQIVSNLKNKQVTINEIEF